MRTDAEFRAHMQQVQSAARAAAKRAMRQSRCRWIDTAIAEGWSKALEDLFASAAREYLRKQTLVKAPDYVLPAPEALPPAWFDGFVIKPDDHKYFQSTTHTHFAAELGEIQAARAAIPRRDKRQMFGEAAE